MEMMKRISFLLILLFAAVFATGANAAFVEFAGFNDTFAFTGMGIIAEVHCIVYYDEGTDEYKYTYEITNNSDIDISFFSVGILDGADVTSRDFDAGTGVDPEYWEIVGSPAQSVNAEFAAIGNGWTSSVLWFISDFAPVEAENGALLGYDSGLPKFASGSLYTPMPVPEPATIALLGTGSLVAFTRKKKQSV